MTPSILNSYIWKGEYFSDTWDDTLGSFVILSIPDEGYFEHT
jgi:hypothetical protein